jgi:hypothetical protein
MGEVEGRIMIFRSKAPLRLVLAGGGSDVTPYSGGFKEQNLGGAEPQSGDYERVK